MRSFRRSPVPVNLTMDSRARKDSTHQGGERGRPVRTALNRALSVRSPTVRVGKTAKGTLANGRASGTKLVLACKRGRIQIHRRPRRTVRPGAGHHRANPASRVRVLGKVLFGGWQR